MQLRCQSSCAQRKICVGSSQLFRPAVTAVVPKNNKSQRQSQLSAAPNVEECSTSTADDLSQTSTIQLTPAWMFLLADVLATAPDAFAAADEVTAKYNPAGGEEFVKNVAGVAYVALVGVFLYRLLKRRAKKSKKEKLAGQPTPLDGFFSTLRSKFIPQGAELDRDPTFVDALLGALQAAALGAGLFFFSEKMTDLVQSKALPDGYTARNISITVRTILLGFSWLFTFVFCVNAVGLSGLALQMALFPDSIKDSEEDRARRRAAAMAAGPQLPKVTVRTNAADMQRAFQEAERQGKAEAAKSIAESNSDSEEVPVSQQKQ